MKLRGHGTLIHRQHLRELRLYGGVVAYYGDVRERLAQLGSRSFPSEACSGYWTSVQALAWFIPEPDAGLVQVQSQDWAARWYPFLEKVEPLPHGGCVGGQKPRQKRFRFCIPRFYWKPTYGPQTGAALRPPKRKPEWGYRFIFLDTPTRAFACIVAVGKTSLAGKRPRHRFQRLRKRCSHFLAAALRAGRHAAAHLWWPLF